MTTYAKASLTATEHRVLDRLVELLRAEFGTSLRAVWLYGSRARGEQPGPESDIDVLAVIEGDEFENLGRTARIDMEAEVAEGARSIWVSTQVYSPERIAQRRAIRSFFIQEVDRDKIVLYGEP